MDDSTGPESKSPTQRLERSAYTASWDPAGGRIVLGPPRKKRGVRFPWIGALCLLVLLMVFKISLYSVAEGATYQRGLDELAAGNFAERFAARTMQPDPVTVGVAKVVRSVTLW